MKKVFDIILALNIVFLIGMFIWHSIVNNTVQKKINALERKYERLEVQKETLKKRISKRQIKIDSLDSIKNLQNEKIIDSFNISNDSLRELFIRTTSKR